VQLVELQREREHDEEVVDVTRVAAAELSDRRDWSYPCKATAGEARGATPFARRAASRLASSASSNASDAFLTMDGIPRCKSQADVMDGLSMCLRALLACAFAASRLEV
jgi:hypothetical protein